MRSISSRLHRAAVASVVAAGVALLGMSVSGIAAMRSDLDAATRPPPTRLVDEPVPHPGQDGRPCRRPEGSHMVGPEV
jgi:hypothetical protein